MVDLLESKLDVILKAIKALLMRINNIEDFVTRVNNDQWVGTSQRMPNVVPQIFSI